MHPSPDHLDWLACSVEMLSEDARVGDDKRVEGVGLTKVAIGAEPAGAVATGGSQG